ncbi:4'-phosphopantetheinyl transferase family protein [Streptomyces sp. NPDC001480]|uniref:4'-phosphopantetheinyl transferase family protein n=1 Tax=Streptomyces sp. NPDC001480 TaxID=3364577 RepID=UPI0036BED6AE
MPVRGGDAAEVEVWMIPLTCGDPEGYPASYEDVLDDGERARAALGREPGMRRRFVTAHAAARFILGDRLRCPPGAVRFTRGPWGKPEVPVPGAPHFSLSHSGELALLALASRPVGVDVEHLRSTLDVRRLARRFFPRGEREWVERDGPEAFGALWTRKEACVKAAGGRLAEGMALPVAHRTRQARVRGGPGGLTGPWRVADVPLSGGYAGAVALLGDTPFSLSMRVWYQIPPTPRTMRTGRGVK